ncbi:hypothetical protein DCCM_0391 [Desulfocucumis palustris]|uniref:Uncharacterized protein n=1 Tax=Desulfocucumis palustris TaxID=1898651 RepID=A0A2L2X854_9FIRM|nr:hypothetical protein [Desulfocucumis palustris]GBF32200.1 hypothetical protein DCCM_0391 [Desulfocucumis palustris]
MAYFDKTVPLQLLVEDFEKLVNTNGWDTVCKYKIVAPATGGKTRKFGAVSLFKSKGTDGQNRNFGVVHAYGGKTPAPLGSEPVITYNSTMGLLSQDSVNQKRFYFKVFPILRAYLKVYVNDTEVNVNDASVISAVDEAGGFLEFAEDYNLPASPEVKATYGVSDDAPDIPSKLWFFTYEDVILERFFFNQPLTYDAASGSYEFAAWVTKIRYGGLTVKNNGVTVDSSNYEPVDWNNPSVKFKAGFSPGTVTADLVLPLSLNGTALEDVTVDAFDIDEGEQVIERVYGSLHYINPSLPTTLSFIDRYTAAWGRESDMFYWGNITKNRIAMFFRVDPNPDPVKAYYVPLYIGKLITFGKSPKINNVMIGGSNVADSVPSDTVIDIGIKKLDYGANATNGNDGVQLQQALGGAFYQKHYLSFITHDDKADISAESRYNPSAYSGKYHISPIYVVHPNDGFVGLLDEVYAVHPKNISQLDELEVIEEAADEIIGMGDGVNKVFHLRHTPKPGTTVTIKVDCAEAEFTRITTDGAGDADEQLKAVTLAVAPAEGESVYATYRYEQTYIFSLATTPVSVYTMESVSPYVPIGLGILKKNEPFEAA